ncbi:MAG: hypothetical protein AAFP68_22785, partial [Pseudomonadota bacterium]
MFIGVLRWWPPRTPRPGAKVNGEVAPRRSAARPRRPSEQEVRGGEIVRGRAQDPDLDIGEGDERIVAGLPDRQIVETVRAAGDLDPVDAEFEP